MEQPLGGLRTRADSRLKATAVGPLSPFGGFVDVELSDGDAVAEIIASYRRGLPTHAVPASDVYTSIVGRRLRMSDSPWSATQTQGRPAANVDACADMLFYAALPTNPAWSLLADVVRVPYAVTPGRPHAALSSGDPVADLYETIEAAVARSIPADERTGVLVTGGLDSAVVAALVAAHQQRPPVLVAVRGGLSTSRECRLQDQLAHELGAELVLVEQIPPFTLEPLLSLNARSDLPAGGAFTHVWDAAVTAATRAGVKVLFTGEGGNDLFAIDPASGWDQLTSGSWRAAIGTWGRCRTPGRRRLPRPPAASDLLTEINYARPGGSQVRTWHSGYARRLPAARRRRTRQLLTLRRSTRSFTRAVTHVSTERLDLQEAAGRNRRVVTAAPLAAHTVADAAAAVPPGLRNPLQCGVQDKHLLRLLGRQYLSTALTETRKLGRPDQLAVLLADGFDPAEIARITTGAEWIGVHVDGDFCRADRLPVETGLAWTRTLALSTWAQAALDTGLLR